MKKNQKELSAKDFCTRLLQIYDEIYSDTHYDEDLRNQFWDKSTARIYRMFVRFVYGEKLRSQLGKEPASVYSKYQSQDQQSKRNKLLVGPQ